MTALSIQLQACRVLRLLRGIIVEHAYLHAVCNRTAIFAYYSVMSLRNARLTCISTWSDTASNRASAGTLSFDEFGRPFIILRYQSTKTRLKGMEAHKVGLLMVQVYLYDVCLP